MHEGETGDIDEQFHDAFADEPEVQAVWTRPPASRHWASRLIGGIIRQR